jgi:hypothetical protein
MYGHFFLLCIKGEIYWMLAETSISKAVKAAFLTFSAHILQEVSYFQLPGAVAFSSTARTYGSYIYIIGYEKEAMSSASATAWPSTSATADMMVMPRFCLISFRVKIS